MTIQKTNICTHERESSRLDNIFNSIVNNSVITSNLENISLAEILEKLQSGDFSRIAKLIFIGLAISEIIETINFSDFEIFLDKTKKSLQDQKDYFIRRYKITETDILLITKIVEGVRLKQFKDEINISHSTANKKIRKLWKRLGLENREQLIFVAGWLRLISPEFECLKTE